MASKRVKSDGGGNGAATGKAGRVFGYLRISTDGQEEGQGLKVQRDTITAYASAERQSIEEWFSDTISGAKEQRPELDRLRDTVRDGDTVLVYKLDRLARDTRIALNIEHEMRCRGARVVSVSEYMGEGAIGDLMRTLLFAFANFERAQIATRTKAGRQSAVRTKGTYAGGRGVLGYRPTGKRGQPGHGSLELNEQEAAGIRRIFSLRKDGATYQAIADQLNAEGFRTMQGASFTRTQVYRVLCRENFYLGSGVLNSSIEAETAAHAPIIHSMP